jgi:hypothetical protein
MKIFTLVIIFISTCVSPFWSQSPGGVSLGLNMWLKADAGTNTVVHNNNVLTWTDQSGVRTNPAQRSSGVQLYQSNLAQNINYNPNVRFDGLGGLTFGNDYIYTPAAQNGITLFGAVKPDITPVAKSVQWIYNFGHYAPSGYGLIYSSTNQRAQSPGDQLSGNHTYGEETSVISYDLNFGVGKTIYRNGSFELSNTISPTALTATQISESPSHAGNAGPVSIGRMSKGSLFTNNNTRAFQGRIAEVIHYSADLSMNQIIRVNSYLAIKYGVTLSTDYLSSTSDVIYETTPPYNSNIIGLARDDNSALIQRQSQTEVDSTRIYLNTLANSNSLNAGTFSSNEQYLIIGDNNEPLNSYSTNYDVPPGIDRRLERVWKIENTDFDGTFSVDIFLNNNANPASVDPNDLRFLVDIDDIFIDAMVYSNLDAITISYSAPVVTVSGIPNSIISMNSTLYFTLGTIDEEITPLPITLLDFNVKKLNDRQAKITWSTLSETNNDFFTLERSKDGQDWKDVYIKNGAGNSTQLIEYSFIDDITNSGVYYYRLKQTDYDLNFTYSGIKSVNMNSDKWSVSPNPATDKLIISGPISDKLTPEIWNISGQKVIDKYSIESSSEYEIIVDISQLSAGSYSIQIGEETIRFIKQ